MVQGCSAWAEIKMTVVDTCCDLVKREFPSIDEDLFQYVKGKKKKNIHSVTEFALKFPINGLNIELQAFFIDLATLKKTEFPKP